MEPSDLAGAVTAATPTHRRGVGVLLSLLVPGAGIFLAGDRKSGLRWYLGLTVLSLVTVAVASLPIIPGLMVCVAMISATTGLTLWMLVLSYKPVPKLGARRWLRFLLLAGLLGGLELLGADRLTRAFKVPTGSMEPTLVPGDRVLVQTSAYWVNPPQRRDVVVFQTDALDSPMVPKGQFFAKRVAGLPGETVRLDNGQRVDAGELPLRLLINDRPIPGTGVRAGNNFGGPASPLLTTNSNLFQVPPECFFVVGDNATNSLDSRSFGAIPRRAIIGRATKIYWPIGRIGDIR